MNRFTWIFNIGLKHFDDASPRGPGWAIHMFFFSTMALWCMLCFSLNLPMGWVTVMFSLVGFIDLFGTAFLCIRNTRNISRLGLKGVLRPRAIVELAAMILTLGFSLGVFAVSGGIPLLGNWQQPMFRIAVDMCQITVITSFVFFLIAMLSGILRNRPVRGRSFELVAFFFWCAVGSKLLDFVLPAIDAENVAIVVVVCSITMLLTAGAISLYQSRISNRQIVG